MARPLEWQQHKPYATGKANLEAFEVELPELSAAAQQTRALCTEAQAEVEELTARLLLGENVQAEVDRANKLLADCKAAAEAAEGAHKERAGLAELMKTRLAELETEARLAALPAVQAEYRKRLKALMGAIEQAASANESLIMFALEAARQYPLGGPEVTQYPAHAGLPTFGWEELLTPEVAHLNQTRLSYWLKRAKEYLSHG